MRNGCPARTDTLFTAMLRVISSAVVLCAAIPAWGAVHVWEKQEITLTAANSFANPYTDVTVWVDLTGPDFKKRIYGFWDGDRTFHVRVVATHPGAWTWRSGSAP